MTDENVNQDPPQDPPAEEPKEKKPSKRQLQKNLRAVAEGVISGKYGTGRERELKLVAAGHNPRQVEREVARLRVDQGEDE
jgi:hypothetical protein